MSEEETLDELLASHRGYKGNLTRKLNTADRALAQASSMGPSTILQEELKELKNQVQQAFDKVEESLCDIQALVPSKEQGTYEAKIEEEYRRTDKMLSELIKQIAEFEPALAPVAATAAGGGG